MAPAAVAHTAPHDELVEVVRDLVEAAPQRSTTLDALANALKSRGFSRPPGSPRLITRLRRIREVEVSRSGVITLRAGAVSSPTEGAEPAISTAEVLIAGPETGERLEEQRPEEPGEQTEEAAATEGPTDEATPGQTPGEEPRRRRRRRGGRRWRARRARHAAAESVAAAAPGE